MMSGKMKENPYFQRNNIKNRHPLKLFLLIKNQLKLNKNNKAPLQIRLKKLILNGAENSWKKRKKNRKKPTN